MQRRLVPSQQRQAAIAKSDRPSMRSRWRSWLAAQGCLLGLTVALIGGTIAPSLAAERVKVRLGPFEQAVEVSDLERFAKTGKIPDELKAYSMVLTPDVRKMMSKSFDLDPQMVDDFLENLQDSSSGNQFLQGLLAALPEQNIDQLKGAIALASYYTGGLNFLNILRALPGDEIVIDASALSKLLLQFNSPFWESQAFTPLLAKELADPTAKPLQTNFDPAATGPETVQRQTLRLRDSKRDRAIPVDVYWSEKPQGPLVVVSHGLGANRQFLAYLGNHLASHGLTVAALEHPGSNSDALVGTSLSNNPGNVLPAEEFLHRPRDISFLLDRFSQLNQEPGSLQGKLNTEQVTVIGHSLGGYTALALAGAKLDPKTIKQTCDRNDVLTFSPANWLQCAAADLPRSVPNLRDERVAQVVALNPVVGHLFGKRGLQQVAVPVLVLAGTEDSLTPALQHQLQPFAQLKQPKYLVSAIGGTHLSVADPTKFTPAYIKTLASKERFGEAASSLRHLLQGTTLAFTKQLTPEAKTYQPFLTAAYAQSLSTAQFPLRMNRELPASIATWVTLKQLL